MKAPSGIAVATLALGVTVGALGVCLVSRKRSTKRERRPVVVSDCVPTDVCKAPKTHPSAFVPNPCTVTWVWGFQFAHPREDLVKAVLRALQLRGTKLKLLLHVSLEVNT